MPLFLVFTIFLVFRPLFLFLFCFCVFLCTVSMYSFPLPLLGERVEGFLLSYTRKYQTCCSLEEAVGLALTLEPLNRVDALPPTF